MNARASALQLARFKNMIHENPAATGIRASSSNRFEARARSSMQVTQGSIENLRLLEAGDGELAFSLGDTVSAAWMGNAEK